MTESIFIAVPAYEDLVLKRTLDDAILKADHPERLFFVVALQYKNIPEPDLSEYGESPNFKFVRYDVDSRPGIVRLRHELAKMHDNQDYFLSIDAHMLFDYGWDTKIISDHKRLTQSHKKAIISKQLTVELEENSCSCTSADQIGEHRITEWSMQEDRPGNFFDAKYIGRPNPIHIPHQDFYQTNYASQHCWFAPMSYIIENGFLVPDLELYCEETYSSYLAFMNGWRIFAPSKMSYIAHDFTANPHLTGENKSLGPVYDTYETMLEVTKSFMFNSGKYAIKNSRHDPYDFYKAIGLEEKYSEYLNSDFYKTIA